MRILRDNTTAIIVDVQERLLPHMDRWEETLARIVTLARGLRTLEIPITLTEQYPRGLGPTVADLTTALGPEIKPMIKASFSCCDDSPFSENLAGLGRTMTLVAGIETHVCILQTTLDLLEQEYLPVVVLDATSSRNPRDRDVAARRIEREGGRVTTVESVLFELTRVSGTPEFKEISRLIR